MNQRNRLLKDLCVHPGLKDTLDIWDMQMVQYGRKIIEKRQSFVEDLNEVIYDIHRNLTGGEETLKVVYEPNVQPENFETLLQKNRERDIRMKMTSAGPHRDDLCFLVNGVDIRKYGSRPAENCGSFFETFRNLSCEEENKGYAGTSSG